MDVAHEIGERFRDLLDEKDRIVGAIQEFPSQLATGEPVVSSRLWMY